MLLACEYVAQVVLEIGTLSPERVADVLAHVTLVAELDHLLRRMDRDAARDWLVVAELAGSRRGEDEGADPLGMVERHPLRHAPAHRMAEHVRRRKAKDVHESDRILRKKARRIPALRGRCLPGAAVIEGEHGMPLEEWPGEFGWPCRSVITRAGDEHDGDTVAAELVRNGVAARLDRLASVDDGRELGVHSPTSTTRPMWSK